MKKWIVLLLLPLILSCGDSAQDEQENGQIDIDITTGPAPQDTGETAPEEALPEYATYRNSRFDFCVRYPVELQAQGQAENQDGQVFVNEEEDIEMIAFGSHALEGSVLNEYQKAKEAYQDYEITYDDLNENWYAISGEKDGRIIYLFKMRKADHFLSLEVAYPREINHSFYPELEKILDSFPECDDGVI